MGETSSGEEPDATSIRKYPEVLRLLSWQILKTTNSGLISIYFLRKFSKLILDFFDAGQLRIF